MRFDGIKEVKSGDEIAAADHNSLAAACRRNTVIAGRNIRIRRTPNGTVVEAVGTITATMKAAESSNHPFKLSYKVGTSGGVTTYTQRIYLPQGSVYVNGAAVECGPARDFFEHPRQERSRDFIRSILSARQ